MSEEEWRPVPGDWPYEVSDQGRVRRSEPGVGTYAGRVLKPHIGPNGYEHVRLCSNGESVRYRVHRLVLRAFLGPCPEGCVTDHINRDRRDNRLSNLRWLNALENQRQGKVGAENWNSRLSDEKVREIRRKYAETDKSQYDLAEEYGVSQTHISDIVNWVRWPQAAGRPREEMVHQIGERNSRARLSYRKAQEIRRRYESNDDLSQADLASEYEVSSSQIGRIVRGEAWAARRIRDREERDD